MILPPTRPKPKSEGRMKRARVDAVKRRGGKKLGISEFPIYTRWEGRRGGGILTNLPARSRRMGAKIKKRRPWKPQGSYVRAPISCSERKLDLRSCCNRAKMTLD